MKIYCKTNNFQLEGGQLVNRIAKYLYKHLESCYNIITGVNTADVYFTIWYQIKVENRDKENLDDAMYEMNVDLSFATYNNGVRVSIIELSPDNRTLGFKNYNVEVFDDLQNAQKKIMSDIIKMVSKKYEEYDFLFY